MLLPVMLLALLTTALSSPGPAPPAPPVWLPRCLNQVRKVALEQGAPLPTDSPRSADYGTCAARCESRCFLQGDFNGDGKASEVAVASSAELLVFHDLSRRGPRVSAVPQGRLPLSGDEVALLPIRRAVRFADEVGQMRDGKSPLPSLTKTERLAFGLIVWHGTDEGGGEDDDDHGQSNEVGDFLLAIYDETQRTYRLHRVLQLGGGSQGPQNP